MIKKQSMISWKHKRYILFLLIVPNLLLLAEERITVSLNGTYDLDNDGMSEFLSIEKLEQNTKLPQTVAYYEIDDEGVHTKIWSWLSPSATKDARIVDMDGNGMPEVAVLTGGQEATQLNLFLWETESFSSVPITGWGKEKGGGNNPSSFTAIDINNDGRDEIAIAIGSPGREIILLQLNRDTDSPSLEVYQRFSSPSLSSGYGQIVVTAIDHNQDGFTDLVATCKELSSLRVQLFANEGGDLVEGPFFLSDLAQIDPEPSGLISSGINTFDIDQDGANEVLLPFRTGQAVALNIETDRVTIGPVAIEVASLFSLPKHSIDNNIVNDILLERAKLGITEKKVLRKLELETTETRLPAPPEELEKIAEVADLEPPILDAEVAPLDEQPAEESDLTAEPAAGDEEPPAEGPEQPRRVRQVQLTTLAKDETEAVPPEEPEPIEPVKTVVVIPKGIDISDTVRVGEKYVCSLDRNEGRRLHAFRPKALPEGAFFDPPAHAVTWTPSENQVGVHRLAYEVEYELSGDNVDVQEIEGVGVQVLTTTETDTVEIFILVRRVEEP